jgi:uncharacterized SAM-binding protein YcdF (DUF218 family)
MRLVVVLGFSGGRGDGLHPICAARLEQAARLASGADAVVLSGWARRDGVLTEAELMRRAWAGPKLPLHCDERSRITAENAVHVAELARELGAREVVVVTSWWHRPRAWLLFRALLRDVRVTIAPVRGPWSVRLLAREVASLLLAPLQLALARGRARPRP